MNTFFFHRIRRTNNVYDKGIEVKADGTSEANYEAAKQAYHAYLGAYAYGHDANTDYVQGMITDMSGHVMMSETWIKAEPEPEPNTEG